MTKILQLSAASVVLLLATTGCSLFDLSYDSRSSEYKEDTGAQSRIDSLERRIEHLEKQLESR